MGSNNTKKQQIQANKSAASLGIAAAVDLTKSRNALLAARLATQTTLSQIENELTEQHNELQAVSEAIALKKQQMTDLHGVDQVLLTIDEAKANHTLELAKIAEERDAAKNAYNTLIKEIDQQRLREQREFDYQLVQTRKTEQDHFNEKLRLRNNQERDRQEAFEKNLAEREAVLKTKENAYNEALTKLSSFDADVTKEVNKQVAIVTNSMNKDFAHKTELVGVQTKANIDGLTSALAQKQQLLAERDSVIETLQTQLKEAYTKNAELATKAVEGAANSKQLSDMQALLTNVGGNGTRPRS